MVKKTSSTIASNRKAGFQYELGTRYEAGLVLQGWEVVAIRKNQVQLAQSYVSIKKGEAWLIHATITPLSTTDTYSKADPLRTRKLLLKKNELNKLIGLCQQKGKTLVPIKMYFKKGKVKLEISVGDGKKAHDKRHTIKERDQKREQNREMKQQRSM